MLPSEPAWRAIDSKVKLYETNIIQHLLTKVSFEPLLSQKVCKIISLLVCLFVSFFLSLIYLLNVGLILPQRTAQMPLYQMPIVGATDCLSEQ